MEGVTPPRTSGNKRAAVSSPVISPPLPNTTNDSKLTPSEDSEEMTLQPSRLADKFDMPPKKKASSAPFFTNTDSTDTSFNWLDPKVYADLIADIPSPTPGEVMPYDFDDDDEGTVQGYFNSMG